MPRDIQIRKVLHIGMLSILLLALAGCFGGRPPSISVQYYALEYPPPQSENSIMPDSLIRLERFAAAQAYHSREMTYRPRPFVREAYRYHRWSSAPVEMVHGLLLRDMRQAGQFLAVLSPEEGGSARYLVSGEVEEFLQIDEKGRSAASLAVGITILDAAREKSTGKIVLQKTYRMIEPIGASQPGELARGMSAVMARFSGELIRDMAAVMKDRSKP